MQASDEEDAKAQEDTEDSDAILEGGNSDHEDKESPIGRKGPTLSKEANDRNESLADAEARKIHEQEEADFQLALRLSQLPEPQNEMADDVQVSGKQTTKFH